ncbi:MAG TPA: DinB family protein, partial [Usitatibacter sp.]
MAEPIDSLYEGDCLDEGHGLYEGERLGEALRGARARTLAIYGHLDLGALEVPCLPIVNPPLWELAHVAWFQEFWCSRHGPARGAQELAGSILARADSLFDSTRVAHDSRWTLDYPSMEAIASYMNDTLEATLEALHGTPEEERYFF